MRRPTINGKYRNNEICRQSVRQIYATKPAVLRDNNYVAKGELPEMDRQQLIQLKALSDKDEGVSSV